MRFSLKSPRLQAPSPQQACRLQSVACYDKAETCGDGVLRILARNPKDYTGPGTNTYLFGKDRLWVIDPGPLDQCHIDAVTSAVAGRPVAAILITHSHMDHSPAGPVLAKVLKAPVMGMPPVLPQIANASKEDIDLNYDPDHVLRDGEVLTGGDLPLQVIHTPGHFPNHLCFWQADSGLLFTGDHVLGWSTTAIVPPLGDLSDYLKSLDILGNLHARRMLPSHGEAVEKPAIRLSEIWNHRAARHQQILESLKQGMKSAEEIVDHIYDGLTPRLVEAAVGQVEAHLALARSDKDQILVKLGLGAA